MVAMQLTVTMLAYSAMKNEANFMELYSVWKPATSSFSASGKSNGTRLVSAKAEIRKRMNAKIWGNGPRRTFQSMMLPACELTIARRLRLFDNKSGEAMASVIGSS